MTTPQLSEEFKKHFTSAPQFFFAPGRVNLIGEHTDYNGGHVFPCALSFGTYCLCGKRTDKKVRLFSLNVTHTGVVEADLAALAYDKKQDWANYPLGVIDVFQKHGYTFESGVDLLFWGNVPNGAGLSSSASIELATAVALNTVFDLGIDPITLVKFGQEAENKFVGMNCGIMDQFASGMGKENHAILLDCNTLKYEHVPLNLDGVSIVIINSHVKHSLVTSAYNERRSQCENALKALQTKLPINALGELTVEEFEKNKQLIKNPVEQKRAKHAVYENQRTLLATRKLREGDLETFGKLMNDSHVSLRDDYETSCPELDIIAEAAWKVKGVLGARITGGGFGGCAVCLVKNEAIDELKKTVGQIYKEKTGITADFYIASVGGPARAVKECL